MKEFFVWGLQWELVLLKVGSIIKVSFVENSA